MSAVPPQQQQAAAAAGGAAAAAAAQPPALAAPAAGQPAEERPPGKCHYYMEKKRRHCKFDAIPGKKYCGNHIYFAEGTGPKRVPCPWEPKGGHTVLETELEKHKHKCPGYRRLMAEQAQPFYSQGINGGEGPDVQWPAEVAAAVAAEAAAAEAAAAAAAAAGQAPRRRRGRGLQGPAAFQAAYAAGLGEQGFAELLCRIKAACEQICEAEPLSLLVPPEAEPFLVPESATCNRPFSLKHAQQQASIVGNMKQQGLLEGAEQTTYIEYGAGKGYLCHMLASCTPAARKVVMMDVRGFKEKADRSMRHLEMQRLRCDIADFDVAGVAGLAGGAAPWVAFGKHLCGAATDFTLRSCARERRRQLGDAEQQAAAGQQQQQQQQQAAVEQAADVFTELGFSPQEFEAIVWMTGWALCGHEAPAGFGGSDDEREEGAAQQAHQAQQQAQQAAGEAAQSRSSHKRSREEEEEEQQAAEEQVAGPRPVQQDAGTGWRPQADLVRERKIAVGQLCKRLIDAARLRWLGRQGFEASLVKYVPSSVSGENRLLVAAVRPAA
ncbi:tRNA:m(4)X modification enzyme TRM13-like protein [Chlorella sorokiniana]|uniref:tRNA:m(4)X modification enzyme TRM13 n=1 Tax=Chlorella sorokiniana TaxID=3076 RepID=A0A2P6TF95_CHLSO|nr:tRNA:m(4)X modification enzyme TRM13-like protein [Chlorella sorokiniana]|eukprot:PRW32644.1 tRNA:m(4)X modification enzyme TRM13-like protein [Chlorella sorokiniana]